MNTFNKILKNAIYLDFIKIGLSLFFYIIVIAIFKAGLDYQSVVKIKTIEVDKKVQTYDYKIQLNDTKAKSIVLKEEKNLFSILGSYDLLKIDYESYYEGNKILAINGSKVFKIYVNDTEVESNFFNKNADNIPQESVIKVLY